MAAGRAITYFVDFLDTVHNYKDNNFCIFVVDYYLRDMKILIASDSYKGTYSSMEVASALEEGFKAVDGNVEVRKIAVADGGEGTVDAIMAAKGGEWITCRVQDPLGRPVDAKYALCSDVAVIEVAQASGLPLLSKAERNPMKTSSFGTGELIADALKRGVREFIVGLGGSATNDCGMGLMSALGVKFMDKDGEVLKPVGESLTEVDRLDLEGMPDEAAQSHFTVICDVDAPLYGPKGAAFTFAPQKGADSDAVIALDEGLTHFGNLLEKTFSKKICSIPGVGAAGGIGAAFCAFLNSDLKPGVDVVLDAVDFDRYLDWADLVITGEGRMDSQTPTGKTPAGVLRRALSRNRPTVAVAGRVNHCESLDTMGFVKIYATDDIEHTVERLHEVAREILEDEAQCKYSKD